MPEREAAPERLRERLPVLERPCELERLCERDDPERAALLVRWELAVRRVRRERRLVVGR